METLLIAIRSNMKGGKGGGIISLHQTVHLILPKYTFFSVESLGFPTKRHFKNLHEKLYTTTHVDVLKWN